MDSNVKVLRVPTGIVPTSFLKDGEKILVLSKIGATGVEWQRRYSIKNLLNEDLAVTEQTLKMEKEMFREPVRI